MITGVPQTAFGQEQQDVLVTVSSLPIGSSENILFAIECLHIIIIPPSPSSKFSIQVDFTDSVPFFKYPESGQFQGNSMKDVNKMMVGNYNVHILDADTIGIYKVRFVGRKAVV